MYTISLVAPEDENYREVEEYDVVAEQSASVEAVIKAARGALRKFYPGWVVVGVVNQPDGYIVWDVRNHLDAAPLVP